MPPLYTQKIEYARASLWLPYHCVGMVARVRGAPSMSEVQAALRKLQVLYPPLASRVRPEPDGSAWLTTEGVGEFPLEVRSKNSDEDWIDLFLEQEKLPFPFEQGPVARFFLLRGEDTSDLVAICPHVVCDGYSMSLVMWDLVALLNDPRREVQPPPPAPSVSWRTVPHSPFDDLFLRGLARFFNLVWPGERLLVRQPVYQDFHQRYWSLQRNAVHFIQLSAAETAALSARCRRMGISVSAALCAAFLLAREGDWPTELADEYEMWIPVNIRDRINPPPGRVVGVYASAVNFRMRRKPGTSFVDLARQWHKLIRKGMQNRAKVLMPLVLDELDPRIGDSLSASLASNRWSRANKLLSSLVRVTGDARGVNLSNIGRLDLPDAGSPYRMETLLPFPPISPGARLSINTLTVNGRMNVLIKYRQDNFDPAAIERIKSRALEYLLAND